MAREHPRHHRPAGRGRRPVVGSVGGSRCRPRRCGRRRSPPLRPRRAGWLPSRSRAPVRARRVINGLLSLCLAVAARRAPDDARANRCWLSGSLPRYVVGGGSVVPFLLENFVPVPLPAEAGVAGAESPAGDRHGLSSSGRPCSVPPGSTEWTRHAGSAPARGGSGSSVGRAPRQCYECIPTSRREVSDAHTPAGQVPAEAETETVLEFGGLRFGVSLREPGATFRVSGPVGDEWTEMLRFDDFVDEPHFHVPSSGPAIKFDRTLGDPLTWYVDQGARPLGGMARASRVHDSAFERRPRRDLEEPGKLSRPLEACVPDGCTRVPGTGLQRLEVTA